MKDSNIAASKNYGDCSVHSCMIIRIIYHYWVIFSVIRLFIYSLWNTHTEIRRRMKQMRKIRRPKIKEIMLIKTLLPMKLQLRQSVCACVRVRERKRKRKVINKERDEEIYLCVFLYVQWKISSLCNEFWCSKSSEMNTKSNNQYTYMPIGK